MGEMADMISDSGFEEWDCEDVPFKCACKWCGRPITMTPTDEGWKPMSGKGVHFCAARHKELLNLMPDLTTPQCQFCNENMVHRKYEEEDRWFPHFHLVCPKCGSTGPRVEFGHPDYEALCEKEI
jgi:hypothetical protein